MAVQSAAAITSSISQDLALHMVRLLLVFVKRLISRSCFATCVALCHAISDEMCYAGDSASSKKSVVVAVLRVFLCLGASKVSQGRNHVWAG